MEANQKLAKSMFRRHSLWHIYTRGKIPVQEIGGKERGGRLLEGGVLSGGYGAMKLVNFT